MTDAVNHEDACAKKFIEPNKTSQMDWVKPDNLNPGEIIVDGSRERHLVLAITPDHEWVLLLHFQDGEAHGWFQVRELSRSWRKMGETPDWFTRREQEDREKADKAVFTQGVDHALRAAIRSGEFRLLARIARALSSNPSPNHIPVPVDRDENQKE